MSRHIQPCANIARIVDFLYIRKKIVYAYTRPKMGQQLAVRIPKSFAAEVGIDQDSEVELSLVNGQLVLVPLPTHPLTLDALLNAITDANLHSEISTGEAVGNEGW